MSTLSRIKIIFGFLFAAFLAGHYAIQSLENAARVAMVLGAAMSCFWLVTWLASPKKAPPPDPGRNGSD